MVTLVDEWGHPPTANQPGIQILAGDLISARSCPPLPPEFAPHDLQRRPIGENRRQRRTLDPVREVGERRGCRIHERGRAGVREGFRIELSGVGKAVVRAELIVQLRGVVPKGRVHGFRLARCGGEVARRPVVRIQVAERIKPPELIVNERAAGIGV